MVPANNCPLTLLKHHAASVMLVASNLELAGLNFRMPLSVAKKEILLKNAQASIVPIIPSAFVNLVIGLLNSIKLIPLASASQICPWLSLYM